jgi:hypothetical protein
MKTETPTKGSALMTKIKTFVPYFKYLVVPL